jgi:hypothetical protein
MHIKLISLNTEASIQVIGEHKQRNAKLYLVGLLLVVILVCHTKSLYTITMYVKISKCSIIKNQYFHCKTKEKYRS